MEEKKGGTTTGARGLLTICSPFTGGGGGGKEGGENEGQTTAIEKNRLGVDLAREKGRERNTTRSPVPADFARRCPHVTQEKKRREILTHNEDEWRLRRREKRVPGFSSISCGKARFARGQRGKGRRGKKGGRQRHPGGGGGKATRGVPPCLFSNFQSITVSTEGRGEGERKATA